MHCTQVCFPQFSLIFESMSWSYRSFQNVREKTSRTGLRLVMIINIIQRKFFSHLIFNATFSNNQQIRTISNRLLRMKINYIFFIFYRLYIYFLTSKIQMYKQKQKHQSSHNLTKPRNPQKKTEWSTDFTDPNKYKLSESQMIQKKASLQSNNREEARQQLEQRRKKLEMGIIDQDTRKVYETALTSKNIDINPPVKKNLSQMIQQERQKKSRVRNSQFDEFGQDHSGQQCSDQEQQKNQLYERQLKQTQAFIKKFERAKKTDKIERAVNILADEDKKNPSKDKKQKKDSKVKKIKSSKNIFENEKIIIPQDINDSVTSSHEQMLSGIEDTIRFMEERLYGSRFDKLKEEKELEMSAEKQKNRAELEDHFHQDTLEISHLNINNDEPLEQDQCLSTIRKVRQMIQSKDNLYDFKKEKENCNEMINIEPRLSKQKAQEVLGSQAEIDFSLTMNNSAEKDYYQEEEPKHFPFQYSPKPKKHDEGNQFLAKNNKEYFSGNFGNMQQKQLEENEEDEYERIKKSIFDEVNKFQLSSPSQFQEHSFQAKTSTLSKTPLQIDESSITNVRYDYQKSQKKSSRKPQKKVNSELEKLKSEVFGTKNAIDSIKVEPLSLSGAEVVGMDFRGSLNIKKNVINK